MGGSHPIVEVLFVSGLLIATCRIVIVPRAVLVGHSSTLSLGLVTALALAIVATLRTGLSSVVITRVVVELLLGSTMVVAVAVVVSSASVLHFGNVMSSVELLVLLFNCY